MKIYDCFTFFNELELLELRLATLNELVDKFVLVEANITHTGKPKEFIFEQNKHLFEKYLDKIIHVKVEDMPFDTNDIWVAENFQRNCILRGLDKIEYGDKIIVSDLDEIPNPETVKLNLGTKEYVSMQQYLFYYHVNCLQKQLWGGSVVATHPYYGSPQDLRNARNSNLAPNGGWHYSFMGGPERIRIKVENIAESPIIIDQVGDLESIRLKIESQEDLWGRTEEYAQKSLVDITKEGMAPNCINEFIAKYPHFYFQGK